MDDHFLDDDTVHSRVELVLLKRKTFGKGNWNVGQSTAI